MERRFSSRPGPRLSSLNSIGTVRRRTVPIEFSEERRGPGRDENLRSISRQLLPGQLYHLGRRDGLAILINNPQRHLGTHGFQFARELGQFRFWIRAEMQRALEWEAQLIGLR